MDRDPVTFLISLLSRDDLGPRLASSGAATP